MLYLIKRENNKKRQVRDCGLTSQTEPNVSLIFISIRSLCSDDTIFLEKSQGRILKCHGNQFWPITLKMAEESSKQSNIILEIGLLVSVLDWNCLIRLIAALRNIFKFC